MYICTVGWSDLAFFAIFDLAVKNFRGPAQHFKVKFWNWGPVTIWHSVQFFLSQKAPHPTVKCII